MIPHLSHWIRISYMANPGIDLSLQIFAVVLYFYQTLHKLKCRVLSTTNCTRVHNIKNSNVRMCSYETSANTMAQNKTSCEPKRTVAYDEDLRWRIVYQRYSLQLNHHNIATNLNIDQSTVCRVIALFDATGDVKKAEYSRKGQTAITYKH